MRHTQDFGLHFYNARWYDSSLGRFTQADSIVPSGIQGYDRYAAMENNPVRYVDPTGHMVSDGLVGEGGGCDRQCWDERNPSPAPKPSKGGGGGSSDEATSSLGEVLGGSKGPGLNSLVDIYSCAEDPNCFSATQEDIIWLSNFLNVMAVAEFLISTVTLTIAGSVLISAPTIGGLTFVFSPPALVLGAIGIETGIEIVDSSSTSSYLETLAQNTPAGGTVEIYKEESLFVTGYYTKDDGAAHGTYMPITRLIMETFAFTSSLDD